MTKGEREDLQRLIRQREKVQKSAAKARSSELLADFENQIAAEYRFDDDAIWAAAAKAAEAEVTKAQERVAVRCQELGIPKQFAPSLRLGWAHRGYDNALDKRRAELRRVARAQVESLMPALSYRELQARPICQSSSSSSRRMHCGSAAFESGRRRYVTAT